MRTLCTLLLACGMAAAQGNAEMVEKLKKRMEEISALMARSEQALHDLGNVDRMIRRQEEIARELAKLKPPEQEQPQAAGQKERQQRQQQEERERLVREQQDVVRKLQEMFDGQRQSADQSVKMLEELLRNLPRRSQRTQQQDRPKDDRKQRQRDREEKKLEDQPRSPREKKEQEKKKRLVEKKPGDPGSDPARLRRVEAWVTRLPPEMQERISRGDLSVVPLRYRQLVKEYTALRAKRESRKSKDR